jgi:hypothetical protein
VRGESQASKLVEQERNIYKILAEKPEGRSSFSRYRCSRCKDNNRIDLRKIRWERVDWIHLDQNGAVGRLLWAQY